MKNNIKRFLTSNFIKNVIVMATGVAGAQAVSIILSPIITRLYGPEAFGIMGTFVSIINIIAPVAALTYPIAIVLPRSDENAKGLIRLSLMIAGVIAVISFILLLMFNKQKCLISKL